MKQLSLVLATLISFLASPAFAINQCTCVVGVVTKALNPTNGFPAKGIDKSATVKTDGYGCYAACRKAALQAFNALGCGPVTSDSGLGQEATALCSSFNRYLQFSSPAK